MMKTKDASRKPKTHFEQIPLKVVVKKITEGAASTADRGGPDNVTVEPASRKSEPYNEVAIQPDGRRLPWLSRIVQ
jgi:hypothetical protein